MERVAGVEVVSRDGGVNWSEGGGLSGAGSTVGVAPGGWGMILGVDCAADMMGDGLAALCGVVVVSAVVGGGLGFGDAVGRDEPIVVGIAGCDTGWCFVGDGGEAVVQRCCVGAGCVGGVVSVGGLCCEVCRA